MAPTKKGKTVAPAPADDEITEIEAAEEIEEVAPQRAPREGATVTFVLDDDQAGHADDDRDEDDEDEEDDDDGFDEDMDGHDDELTTAVGQLTQLMMTEEGEAITDVLRGLREAVEKQNKILYRGLQLLESRFGRR